MSADRAPAVPRWDALDGLRAVSVMAVMLLHSGTRIGRGGFLGVDVFFVLSGYLITTILTREWDRRGGIRFGTFYARRGLRLLPALWVVVGLSALYAVTVEPRTRGHATLVAAWSSLLYVADLVRIPANGLLGHTWSLGVEEQFYLVWPVLLYVLLRYVTRRRAAAAATLAAAFAVAGVRYLRWQSNHGPVLRDTLTYRFDARADSLLIGCSLGLLLSSGATVAAGLRWLIVVGSALGAAVLLVLFLTTTLGQSGLLDGGYTVAALAAALIILHLVTAPGRFVQMTLANPVMVGIGRISYGLYLWHLPLFKVLTIQRLQSLLACGPTTGRVLQFLLAFPVAIVSWYCIETPFLRLKDRLGQGPDRRPGRPAAAAAAR